jgi:hypothetical protein
MTNIRYDLKNNVLTFNSTQYYFHFSIKKLFMKKLQPHTRQQRKLLARGLANIPLLIAILLCSIPALAQTTFTYTGGVQTYTVPAGVTSINVTLNGAQGGTDNYGALFTGALGGRVSATLAVTPGAVLNIYVGGRGPDNGAGTGGYNGGGNGTTAGGGAGGGGASDIRLGGTALSNRIIVAGGGGGAGEQRPSTNGGGAGGGLTGAIGLGYSGSDVNAGGGTQTSGGTAGYYSPASFASGTNGSQGVGGDGWNTPGYLHYGGGGGGGYYGGGGNAYGYGGGGSSYTDPTFASSVVHSQGVNGGNGSVIICTPLQATTGNTSVCLGTTNTLSNTAGGGTWSSSNTLVATVGVTTGAVSGLAVGTAIISYVNTCGIATTTVSVNSLPNAFAVTGGGAYCSGGGGSVIGVQNTQAGVSYQLYNGSGAVGSAQPGSGPSVSFGAQTAAGTYSVVGTNTVTGCKSNMANTVSVSINPLPTVNTVSNQTACNGATQNAIAFTGSVGGTSYSWTNSNPAIGLGSGGTGIVCGTTAGENVSVTLTAPAGSVFTSIEFASYGTPNGSCGSFSLGSCHASNSMSVVSSILLGHNSGTITANNTTFTDPCFGTGKRLYVQARYSSTGNLPSFTATNAGTSPISGLITVTPTANGCMGAAQTFSITVNPQPSAITGNTTVYTTGTTSLSNADGSGAWASTNTAVATVNGSGVVTGVGAGTSTISFTLASTGCTNTTVVTDTTAAPAGALHFDGNDDYVEVPHTASLSPANVTLECWVKPGRSGILSGLVTKEPTGASSQIGYGFRQRPDNKFWFVIGREGSGVFAASTTLLVPGTWYHLAGTFDGSKVRLYVNGVLEGTTTTALGDKLYSKSQDCSPQFFPGSVPGLY